MNHLSSRELKLAQEETLILMNNIQIESPDLTFLEIHARALLDHILSAQETLRTRLTETEH